MRKDRTYHELRLECRARVSTLEIENARDLRAVLLVILFESATDAKFR
jgi:hypothetical protein